MITSLQFALYGTLLLTGSLAVAQSAITEFPNIPGAPRALATGPDGALWFGGTAIGRISTDGTITTFPTSNAIQINGIVTGPDGALWFTDSGGNGNAIGRITTSGAITEFPVPAGGYVDQIATGPDGALWFSARTIIVGSPPDTAIWRITTAGTVTSFPTSGVPSSVTAGPDGAMWFTEDLEIYSPNLATVTKVNAWIGRIDTTTGAVTEYTIPNPAGGITTGPDGALWFGGASVGRITTQGIISTYPVPSGFGAFITTGPDGALWGTDEINFVGRITASGVATEYEMPAPDYAPAAIITGPDGAIWFTEFTAGSVGKIGTIAIPVATTLQTTNSAILPAGQAGLSYSQFLSAVGGTQPYTWSLASGSLPAGLTLSSTGLISGTPSSAGIQTITVQVTDANSATATETVTLTFNPPACMYTITASPPFPANTNAQMFTPAGGSGVFKVTAYAPCVWTVAGVPTWMTITSAASGSGTGLVSYSVAPNNTPATLNAILSIGGVSYMIQEAAGLIPASGSMPHLAAEGGWLTSFTLVNKGSFTADTQLNLFDNNGNPLALPLSFPQQASLPPVTEASVDQTIAANASLIVEASGPANVPYVEGSAQMASAGNVDGFAIFHFDPSGQEAVVPLQSTAIYPPFGRPNLLAFDNTNSVSTGIAIQMVNDQGGDMISITLRDDTGAYLGTAQTITLPQGGHTSFVLSAQYPVTANMRGTVEFDPPCVGSKEPLACSTVGILGIRYTPPGTLTTIPVLPSFTSAQGSFAHIASGDGWQTTFVLVNTGINGPPVPPQAQLNFFDDNGNPLALPLTFPQLNESWTASSLTPSFAPDASLWIQTSGPLGSPLLTGSAQLTALTSYPYEFAAYAIYRYLPNGQEAVVPLETRNASSYLIPFDNTGGIATGIAISAMTPTSNSSASAQITSVTVPYFELSVPVILRDDTGAILATTSVAIEPNGHDSFLLATQFPATAGIRGTIEFDAPAGTTISVLGIRSPPALTFTTLPALAK